MNSCLVVGGTGLVGKHLVKELEASNDFDLVYVLVRKKQFTGTKKTKEIFFDFTDKERIQTLEPVNHVFCCLGTTIKKAGSKANFIQVDHDYPLAFAAAAKKWESSIFSIITAAGVSPESKIFYNNVKGQLEKKLKSLELFSTLIFRPSLLLGERKEFRLGEKIGSGIAKVTSWMTPKTYRAIHCKAVAKAMLAESFADKTGFNIISNKSMHRFS